MLLVCVVCQIDELVKALDADADGEISFKEFNTAFRIVDNSNGVAMKPSPVLTG